MQSYLKRHFHAIAVDQRSRLNNTIPIDTPLIVFANHASWWDPLIAHFLNQTLFAPRQLYAPIDAKALERYKVFEKLGFFGVDLETKSGAAKFLKVSDAIFKADTAAALWMTPEGQFADARNYQLPLMPGLAHLCSRRTTGVALPLAMEYVFWNERLPLCLVKLGTPIEITHHVDWDKPQWNHHLHSQLRETQSELAELSIGRDSDPFDNLLSGKKGTGFLYDSFRRAKSLISGRKFQAAHGEQFE